MILLWMFEYRNYKCFELSKRVNRKLAEHVNSIIVCSYLIDGFTERLLLLLLIGLCFSTHPVLSTLVINCDTVTSVT